MTSTNVLVVEDDPTISNIIENQLKRLGYSVLAIAPSGEEAIQLTKKTRPELVLMDILIPGEMDGVEAAEQIRSYFDIPVIFLSAHDEKETIKRTKLTEPFSYLLKPIDPRVLQSTIEMALYKHKMERNLRESENIFRSIVENSGDGIVLINEEGNIEEWNRGQEQITGLRRDDVIGKAIWSIIFQLIPPEKMKTTLAQLKNDALQLLQSGEGSVLGNYQESEFLRADGEQRVIQTLIIPIDTGRGFVLCGFSRDVTVQKQKQEELERRVRERTDEVVVTFEQVRAGRERLQGLSKRLLEIQEVERRYLAQELHDEIGQTLTSLKLSLELIPRDSLPSDVQDSINQAQDLAYQLLGRVREMSLDLRPAMLDDLGLLPALLWLFERYSNQTKIRVDFAQSGLDRRFPPGIETTAYRIVQEALTNVARHAAVDNVTVRMWASEDTIGIQVEDKGAGFDVDTTVKIHLGLGLSGMNERAVQAGGKLEIESSPGQGTCLTAEIPLRGNLERRKDERFNSAS